MIGETLFYNETLPVNLESLRKLSAKTAELNDEEVNLYAWIVDGGGDNGIAWLGSACKTGSGENSKTSLVRGPSRYNAIIETAEVVITILKHYSYLIDNIESNNQSYLICIAKLSFS